MALPWSDLGLAGARILAERDERLLDAQDAAEPRDVPTVVFGATDLDGSVLDLAILAGVLLPTLRDHQATTLFAHFDLSCSEIPTADELASLFEALIGEAMSIDREILATIAGLSGGAYAALLQRVLLHAAPPCANDEAPKTMASPSDATAADASAVDVLGADGPISAALREYEARPGQLEMAREVDEAFFRGGACLVEAGPGTGKTFAYLVPAILTLLRSSARVIVSTRTKQLQEQLFHKDLPFLLEALGATLKVALLKGRSNYLCLRRWQLLVSDLTATLDQDRLATLAPLVRWIVTTRSGDIEENTAFLSQPGARALWGDLCDTPSHCIDEFCPHMDECFAILARRRARAADLVVINHSLLLGDLAAGGLVLGKYTHLVVDEAHALEPAARAAFTRSLSEERIDRFADDILPIRRRRQGWLAQLPLNADSPGVRRCTELLGGVRALAQQLFAAVSPQLSEERSGRIPSWKSAEAFVSLADRLSQVGLSLESLLDDVEEPDLAKQGETLVATTEQYADLARTLMAEPEDNAVHWYEKDRRSLDLHVSPLDIAPLLAERLYPGLQALLLTSATLSLDGDFSYVTRSLGLDGALEPLSSVVVPSPFDHADRMRVYVPRYLPEVTAATETYADGLADLVASIVRETGRKALVLCTSYRLLHALRDRIPDDLPTLAQGVDGPRSRLVERFRQHPGRMILLGADSFWEGVDLPGDALEVLVVTRLPFPVPSDPIQAALGERLARDGGDPFSDLAVPQAILRLRQGIGRLIRTQQDHGIAVITDHRILSKGYGRRFARSLPVPVRSFASQTSLLQDAAEWFGAARREMPNVHTDTD